MSNHRRLFDVAFALALTPACGANLQGQAELDATSSIHDALAPGVNAGSVDEDESALPPATVGRVRAAYARLKSNGSLDEPAWRFNERPPAGIRFARVELENDADRGISDGYMKAALVQLDPDGAAPYRFYVIREGGIAGWEFLAGPFDLDPATVVLSDKNTGETVEIKKADKVKVELPYNPATGYAWDATHPGAGMGVLRRRTDPAARPGGWGRMAYTWDTHNAELYAGNTYQLYFAYKRPKDRHAHREVLIKVRVH